MTRNQETPPGYDDRSNYPPPQPSYNNDSSYNNNNYQSGYHSQAQGGPQGSLPYGSTPAYGSHPPQPSYQINPASGPDYTSSSHPPPQPSYNSGSGPYAAAGAAQSPYQQYNSYPSPAPSTASPSGYRQQDNYYAPPAGPPPGHPASQVPPLTGAEDPNGERGIMGALAGGAAGGYAGHKVHHGVIGTLGGAFAGHKLEDAYKDKKKKDEKKKEEEKKQQQQQQYMPPAGPPPAYAAYHGNQGNAPPQQGGGGQVMAGNFSGSSREVALDRDFDLIARCRAVDGSERLSSLSLNKHLGNSNGAFCWLSDGGNFAGSARNIVLTAGGSVLEAELRDREGQWRFARVQLDERVGNSNGELVYC